MDGDVRGLAVPDKRWRYTIFIHRTLTKLDDFVMLFYSGGIESGMMHSEMCWFARENPARVAWTRIEASKIDSSEAF